MKARTSIFILLFAGAVGSCACSSPKAGKHSDAVKPATPAARMFAPPPVDAVYNPADSLEIVRLLTRALREFKPDEAVLSFARHFVGRPYVGQTLEQTPEERLIVNLKGLDCTTLVETVSALTLTYFQKSTSFADYCANLQRLRYFDGRCNGYCSRLHYFGWWIADNERRGLVTSVDLPASFASRFTWNTGYMSVHPDKYRHLAGRPARIDSIRALERRFNGTVHAYLPKDKTGLSRNQLSMIRNGDILAIVTSKKGLDYAHLGFAVWGRDGKLHLLNASSIYKKVVEDEVSLQTYLSQHPSFLGVEVLRLTAAP